MRKLVIKVIRGAKMMTHVSWCDFWVQISPSLEGSMP